MKLISLTKGYSAQVDDEDYEYISSYKWYADVGPWTVYAKTDQLMSRPRMHVEIMQPPKGLIVHHVDNDGLNNQRWNLEVLTQAEHGRLSRLRKTKQGSKYRGVYFHKQREKFVAEITINYQKTYLGIFLTEEEAALAYNEAMVRFGLEGPINEVAQ